MMRVILLTYVYTKLLVLKNTGLFGLFNPLAGNRFE